MSNRVELLTRRKLAATWETETLKMEKYCFVVSVIGKKDSDERKHADRLLKYIISPAVGVAGFTKVQRADHFDETGMITLQIVEAILNADMVIADLTYPNPNVYYELAIRHFTGKPLIQMMTHGTILPFDVAQVRTVEFGLQLEEAENARKALEKMLQVAGNDPKQVVNPITQAREISTLKSSVIDHANVLATVLEVQNLILSQLRHINEQMERNNRSGSISVDKSCLDDLVAVYLRKNGLTPVIDIFANVVPTGNSLADMFKDQTNN